MDASVERLFYWGAYADKYGGEVQETTLYGATVKVHEPVGRFQMRPPHTRPSAAHPLPRPGPIGICCPDECPLLGFVSLFAPAVVRGNTIVIVPSEKYPLAALDLYQVSEPRSLRLYWVLAMMR